MAQAEALTRTWTSINVGIRGAEYDALLQFQGCPGAAPSDGLVVTLDRTVSDPALQSVSPTAAGACVGIRAGDKVVSLALLV